MIKGPNEVHNIVNTEGRNPAFHIDISDVNEADYPVKKLLVTWRYGFENTGQRYAVQAHGIHAALQMAAMAMKLGMIYIHIHDKDMNFFISSNDIGGLVAHKL